MRHARLREEYTLHYMLDVERVGTALRPSPPPGAEEAQKTRVEAGNPVGVAMPPVPPEFNSDMAGLLERKRQEWLVEGVRPNLVRMGLDQAVSQRSCWQTQCLQVL